MLKTAAAAATGSALSSLGLRAASASTPRRGGTLRIGLGHGNSTDSYDPATFIGGFMQAFSFARYNCLTEIAADGSLAPELAESWEPSSDAKQWVFNLRKSVEFHNGKTMDAQDVIASINHHRGPESTSAMKPVVDQIAEIRSDGPNRVILTLEHGNADFAYTLSDYHMVIAPAHEETIDWQSGVGTGGYVVDSFDPGIRAALSRHENYWKENAAYFDNVEMLTIADANARISALLSGQLDVIDRIPFATASRVKSLANVKLVEVTGSQHYSFAMNTQFAPFDDNDVRLALKYAIDREKLVQNVLSGHGRVANDHPIGPAYRYEATQLEQRVYDPDRARSLLKKAGHDSLTVELSAADAAFSGAVDAATLFREAAASAGITINVKREPNDGYWSDVWMKKPFSAVFWRGRPTEDWMFSTVYIGKSPWNDTFWENESFARVVNEARTELDEGRRRSLYAEAQALVRDEGGAIIPMFANYLSATNLNVEHPERLAASDDLDGMRLAERWWFKS
ncbi:ABC transporter substrate-binding protein [Aquamicrobium ahrensii]|uniref:Peptide/nickel transport system substrate-binding protein n=1 Tax=Aquamicrobium ahrensii TaxID=469551 RepID=A0ABV2KQE4_9HYPH